MAARKRRRGMGEKIAQTANQRSRRLSILIVLGLFAAILIFMGAIMLFESIKYKDVIENGAPDFNTMTIAQIEEEPYVSGNIELVLECFAESYTTTNGVRTSNKSDELFYLVPAAVTDADGYYEFIYLISVKVKGDSQYRTMDKIMDETWATDFTGEYTLFEIGTSKVNALGSKMNSILDEYCEDVGLVDWLVQNEFFGTSDEAEVRSRILRYSISVGSEPATTKTACFVLIPGLVLLIVFVLVLRKKPTQPDAQASSGDFVPYTGPSSDDTVARYTESAEAEQVSCPDCGAQVTPDSSGRCPYCGSLIR